MPKNIAEPDAGSDSTNDGAESGIARSGEDPAAGFVFPRTGLLARNRTVL